MKDYERNNEIGLGKIAGFSAGGVVVLFVLYVLLGFVFGFGPTGSVPAGSRGVHLRFGAVVGTKSEGLYFRLPLVDSVKNMDVQVQKEPVTTDAASKDLQTVTTTVALNYHVDPGAVETIYKNVGMDYRIRIIDPALQEAIKAVAARFTAEELITQREAVREATRAQVRDRLAENHIIVDEFNITNFQFSKVFNEAIEAKVTAEQQALAAKNKLEQVKFEADQKVAEAKGKAEAMTVESNALKSNPQILELRALEKWDGHMPQVTGAGGVPFITLSGKAGF